MTRARRLLRLHCLAFLAFLVTALGAVSAASAQVLTGIIPLQLTTAETSYLGVTLQPCTQFDPFPRNTQDARLPVTNDGGNLHSWASSIPLQVLKATTDGTIHSVEVTPLAFNLIGTQVWTGLCNTFTYDVRLDPNRTQPISTLYFETDANGYATSFAGTLYVAALLRMTAVDTAALSLQPLTLALNVGGRWTNRTDTTSLDPELSSILPFTSESTRASVIGTYACVNETHRFGRYCLQLSSVLLTELNGL